jgi:hypothetical protein
LQGVTEHAEEMTYLITKIVVALFAPTVALNGVFSSLFNCARGPVFLVFAAAFFVI